MTKPLPPWDFVKHQWHNHLGAGPHWAFAVGEGWSSRAGPWVVPQHPHLLLARRQPLEYLRRGDTPARDVEFDQATSGAGPDGKKPLEASMNCWTVLYERTRGQWELLDKMRVNCDQLRCHWEGKSSGGLLDWRLADAWEELIQAEC